MESFQVKHGDRGCSAPAVLVLDQIHRYLYPCWGLGLLVFISVTQKMFWDFYLLACKYYVSFLTTGNYIYHAYNST